MVHPNQERKNGTLVQMSEQKKKEKKRRKRSGMWFGVS